MRPLPRLLAVSNDAVCRAPDFAARAAGIAAAGAAAGVLVRAPEASAAEHAGFAERGAAALSGSAALLLVHARPDLARAVDAGGVQLRRDDLPADAARAVLGPGWIGVAVHSRAEAEAAIAEGADFVVAGNLFATASHPDRPARGTAWLAELCSLPKPVIAIGGITPARAAEVRRAGAWGVAAIAALWEVPDSAAAAVALLAAWENAA
ncbi:MAG TPA: thiamine phosphate synthase [Gemmatimonadales bacterium]|nr:thiamine phosphate synthase [Gemmatimonadales bacterium]